MAGRYVPLYFRHNPSFATVLFYLQFRSREIRIRKENRKKVKKRKQERIRRLGKCMNLRLTI